MAPISDEKKKSLIHAIIKADTNIVANVNQELEDAGIKADTISADDIVRYHMTGLMLTVKAALNISQTLIDEVTADETR
jgi:hypothetical protein